MTHDLGVNGLQARAGEVEPSINDNVSARMSSCPRGRSTPRTTLATRFRDGRVRIIFNMITTSNGVIGPPRAHQATVAMMPMASTTAAARSQMLSGCPRADAHALSAAVSMSRDGPPAVPSASRKSRASRSSTTDACRWRIVAASSGSAQPAREDLFTEVRPGAGQQLEQRRGTEDIEVARIHVVRHPGSVRSSRRRRATRRRCAQCRVRKMSRRGMRGPGHAALDRARRQGQRRQQQEGRPATGWRRRGGSSTAQRHTPRRPRGAHN